MWRSWVGVALAAVLALSGVAGALPADRHVTLEADNGESCVPEGKTDCFRVANGSLEDLAQGMRVHLTVVNVGSAPHNAFATAGSNADSTHVDTPASAAVNNTDTTEPGGNASMVFQVPEDAESLYVWCDIDGHETGGMWLNASVSPATNVSTGEDSTGGPADNETNASGNESGGPDSTSAVPAPGVLAALVAGLAASRLARRT